MSPRIAMINLTTGIKHGGIETFVIELSKSLEARGLQVDLYVAKGDIKLDLPESINIFRFDFIDRDHIWDLGSRFRKFAERLSFGFHAWRELKSHDYDYIYVHKPYDLPLALYYRHKRGGQVIYSSHGTEFFFGYKNLIRACDFVFSCSQFNAQQVFDYCGLMPRILYNGVNTERFRPLSPDRELARQLQIDSDQAVMFTAARLVGWKGIQHAIEGMANSRHKTRLRYLIGGEGPYRDTLKELAHMQGLTEQVIFIGQIPNEELPRYYSLANIALYPSVADETFGISIAEAMATNTPVITCQVGGIPEVVGKDSIMVPPKRPDLIAQQIDHILDSGFRGSPRTRIKENFTWDRITDSFMKQIRVIQ